MFRTQITRSLSRKRTPPKISRTSANPAPAFALEGLEDRRLLSVTPAFHVAHSSHRGESLSAAFSTTTYADLQTSDAAAATELNTLATADGVTLAGTNTVFVHTVDSTTTDYSIVVGAGRANRVTLISDENGTPVLPTSGQTTFNALSAVDSAAATELSTLASTDGQTLADSQVVQIVSHRGTTTYSVVLTPSVGTIITLTTDASGNPVTNATKSRETFSDLAAADSAASSELTLLATDLSLTAPDPTQTVYVSTLNGNSTYTIYLSSASGWRGRALTVDGAGNPAGNESVPFEALSTLIQTGLNNLAAPYSTSFASDSTQNVEVQTANGITTYTVRINGAGSVIKLTVDAAGNVATPPTRDRGGRGDCGGGGDGGGDDDGFGGLSFGRRR